MLLLRFGVLLHNITTTSVQGFTTTTTWYMHVHSSVDCYDLLFTRLLPLLQVCVSFIIRYSSQNEFQFRNALNGLSLGNIRVYHEWSFPWVLDVWKLIRTWFKIR